MDNVVRFTAKSELERERFIREARAIYESIFPSADPADEHACPDRTSTSPTLNPSSAHRRSDTR